MYTNIKILTKSFMVTVDVTTLGSLTGMLGYTTKNLALYSQLFLVKWLIWTTTAHPRAMPGHLKWQPASSSSKKWHNILTDSRHQTLCRVGTITFDILHIVTPDDLFLD